ncbi:hypothetical protein [Methanoregula sp.]|jgi:hypothetical protein|uniref:hypothetical protein n=1 Tax=Methanoregula sp. TaxID=2052170 RepID=UPI003C75CA99
MKEVVNKKILVTEETWESFLNLKKPGQTYNGPLAEMIALKQKHDFLTHLEEVKKIGQFVSLEQVARELNIHLRLTKNKGEF